MKPILTLLSAAMLSALPLSAVASIDISIIGGLTREAVVQPGDRIEGKIIVSNTRAEEQQVKTYQTDYLYYADGRNAYGEPGSCERSNAAWITVTPQQFAVPPEGNATIYYTIQVPNGPNLAGTYWSLLMVEPLSETSPELMGGESQPHVAVRTVMRYGIQMVTEIGRTGETSLRFGDKQLTAADGQRTLVVDVENTGERWLSPLLWVELYDTDGASVGRFEGQRIRIFPTCSARFHVDLTELPAGTYKGLIVADNGDDNVFGTEANLQLK